MTFKLMADGIAKCKKLKYLTFGSEIWKVCQIFDIFNISQTPSEQRWPEHLPFMESAKKKYKKLSNAN